jgi:hypothetical protein
MVGDFPKPSGFAPRNQFLAREEDCASKSTTKNYQKTTTTQLILTLRREPRKSMTNKRN